MTQSASHRQESHVNQARASLQQALSWYGKVYRHGPYPPDATLQAAVRDRLRTIESASEKLDDKTVRIATFGLVSRGKSAVINALLGQKVMHTGPLHGVTRWPQSARWTPPSGKVIVEFIDTPGLDEIAGQERAQMAREVAAQSDLILFVVAGDITRTEYQALCELRAAQKPLLIVFNKVDLYPDADRERIYQQLQQLGAGESGRRLQQVLSADEIVTVAAAPAPMHVRVERPDAPDSHEWETPPPQIDALRAKILDILNREGRSLLALNALFQAREAEVAIAQTTLQMRRELAEALIWRYARNKSIAVGINPIAVLDAIGGAIADLALIRALARLYGLPMTSHEAGKLWRTILFSSGGLLLGELVSSVLLGFGKSASAVVGWDGSGLAAFGGTALLQAGIAGYGAYAIGRAAQDYLERGCSWGPLGPSTTIRDILEQVEPNAIVYRLRQELGQQLA
ncbi:GTPase SAR1 [Rubidibacter lacunae KORDI 51-2]|uniref:GTPase SAR1 n=1 Tax=Rubidibacter lacunae KORDI 51-2 TaxID=582515 RepID=U5DLH5_9CHRO|nr:GTP-binding protein [Rubidibacter lacunae]ERN41429.1 GTPase SAR1 [Rubidibacter lacunae KORDI 51-2]